ncbi:tRNA pseudouridine synthase A [Acidovorax delafieldii 2AN]|uniref:tRNA pseudouridine synthase A n=1 Tax=Acidovorax delafieldii 2AN TaxID=573060 RepID=C5T803_ACIDE|nr:tRNA pseudouridine(38-40) synthase TruA [Acidovorax delafieldii]EER59401.1 tRNA pseudouridine synthase A [Acidovorax delafieldii 2AN]
MRGVSPDASQAAHPGLPTRVALGVSYNGQRYNGWQSQPSGNTVQDHLEAALGRFTTQQVSTLCAGRTDAGVHGLMQVVHFDTTLVRPDASWVRGTNAFLPQDIAVQWARAVPSGFHARASAVARRYAYVLLQSPVRPSVEAGRVGWVFNALNEDAMRQAALRLLGEHDFTSFRASACQAKSPVKTLQRIDITRTPCPRASAAGEFDACYWRFEFEANAFLHHMIRNIMGSLVAVGKGTKPPSWISEVLDAHSRDAAAPTFSPDGLYFQGPVYAPQWGLPGRTAAYDWLP